MKRRLLHTLAALTVALPLTAMVATTPASASDRDGYLCILNQNTWLRAEPQGFVLRTLSAGRGFRAHGGSEDYYGSWLWGHGAEDPSLDGWIPRANCS